jgi:ribonuclease E
MTKRMLIDATHAEETRVVVLEGSRLEDFDVETQSRKQLKGNIYLAKVVRVEPSLQAAFVEYGGNRHGFLAFSEIHPDYYQIPVADRQRLLQMQEEEARAEEDEDERQHDAAPSANGSAHTKQLPIDIEIVHGDIVHEDVVRDEVVRNDIMGADVAGGEAAAAEAAPATDAASEPTEASGGTVEAGEASNADDAEVGETASYFPVPADPADGEAINSRVQELPPSDTPPPETIGGETDAGEEVREHRRPPRFMRNYKIQEVIRRRQIMLIQVVKEERGTKGAALTTYISLAGRYCVLMPNSPRGGGISRKITSATDRRRLKEVTSELDIPRGMSLIVRTAGANRPKPEIKRDCEYLLRLWDDIRDHTLHSVAPALIYEEASLIKRAIRDVYSRDVDEVIVDGEDGWKAARDFMRMLMPTHVKKVQLWRDGGAPLFARQQVEAQLDAMLSPTVQLRSGGYLVINQTEALVAIDVNSGRSTRERGIEETASRTNLEAADEVARQLRLRDLAGLIVIDFIDMESKKNIGAVERRLKEALKSDRARIQVGHISHFGLMEMSRQRLRPSLAETSLTACPHCGGTGHVRSTESAALHVLRAVEEEGSKRRAAEIIIHVPAAIALYILNHKRQRLTDIEVRYAMKVNFAADESLLPSQPRIDRLRVQTAPEPPPPVIPAETAYEGRGAPDTEDADVDNDEDSENASALNGAETAELDADVPVPGETAEEGERRRRRRRRRRRGGPRREEAQAGDGPPMPPGTEQPDVGAVAFPAIRAPVLTASPIAAPTVAVVPPTAASTTAEAVASESPTHRGRSRRKKPVDSAVQAELAPLPYAGPTPADPFGGGALDIFDVLERAESLQATSVSAPANKIVANAEGAPQIPMLLGTPDVEVEKLAEAVAASESEPFIGAPVQPVVIGEAAPATERKRGWWRR